MSEPERFDLCVIGAGSGGLSVASGAAQLGLKTALIEADRMGGDCLNTGCVPSKAMIAEAKRAHARYGFGPTPDRGSINAHIANAIATIAPHDSVERFEGLGVRVIAGEARFRDAWTLDVNGRVLKAKKFVIAAGSRPAIPTIDGLDASKVLTNETLFELTVIPSHLIVIGGGAMGVEMAQAHRRLGSDVTMIVRSQLLSGEEPELCAILHERLEAEGIAIFERAEIAHIEHLEDGGHRVTYSDGKGTSTVRGSHVVLATGRTPNTDRLDLDKAGVTFTAAGIVTDMRQRTSHKHIFAIGDIIDGPRFTHVAGYQAGIVIRNLAFRLPTKADYSSLPRAIFTDPELARAGLTAEQARQRYGQEIVVLDQTLAGLDRAITENRTEGAIRIVTRTNGKILGCSILAPHAGEMIGLWSLAIAKGLKLSAIASLTLPYPTYSEISKLAAARFYAPKLFSERTRTVVKWLQKLPF